jgi:Holliday junction resolvase RusA-like endonuclease
MFAVSDLMIVSLLNGKEDEVSFTIKGRPVSSNGPRVTTTRSGGGCFYNPQTRQKAALRGKLLKALSEFGYDTPIAFPLFSKTKLVMHVWFCMQDIYKKDHDNMLKFLQDTMESVVYDNDKFIINCHSYKDTMGDDGEKTIVRIIKLV